MKSINESERNLISAIYNELQTNINISALEKDIHITKIIKELTQMELDNFELIFCGGTCLSKAYGILERMSEDVDFKLVLKKDAPEFSNNELRSKLSEVKHIIKNKLISLDYISKEDTENTNNPIIKALDGNKYIGFDIPYINKFPSSIVLRPHIQIELNYTKLQLDIKQHDIDFIYNDLIENKGKKQTVKCISLEESFCERLISFPRRLAHAIANNRMNDFDQTLIRHLYDIHQIKEKNPDIDKNEELIKSLMKTLIQNDATDFSNQHQEFINNPIGELNKAMSFALSSNLIRKNYDDFLEHMVYQDYDDKPTFDTAINTFTIALNNSVKHIQDIKIEILTKQEELTNNQVNKPKKNNGLIL